MKIGARHFSIANNWVGQFKRRLTYRIVPFHLDYLMEIRLRRMKFLIELEFMSNFSFEISCLYEYFHVDGHTKN